jgi:hypothetical protein
VDDVHEFAGAVKDVLTDAGVFIVEVPYFADLLEKLEFDTVYHEHLSYFSIGAMQELCRRQDMELVDAEPIALHGGSVVFHMQRSGANQPSARLTRLVERERERGLASPDRLAAFASAVRDWKRDLEGLIDSLRQSGAQFVGYGAAAKANTLLNYCPSVAGSLQVILDRSPHKHGRYTPGTHVRVEPADRWSAFPATHMLILAWNFQEEIVRQMKGFEERGGRFVVPIPKPRVI